MEIGIYHKHDGYEEYDVELFKNSLPDLENIANKYPSFLQIGNNIIVSTGDLYNIVEIVLGTHIMVYVVDV